MKPVKAIRFFICCAIAAMPVTRAAAQDSPCTYNWTEWYNVYTFAHNVNFQISFKYQIKNRKGGECGQSYYRINNPVVRPGAHLEFKFDYRKKDGSIGTENFEYVELKTIGVHQANTSNWYQGFDMVRIYDVKYFDPQADKDRQALADSLAAVNTRVSNKRAADSKTSNSVQTIKPAQTTTVYPGANMQISHTVSVVNTQKQQYQQQANSYLQAADKSPEEISKAMNLNLAKTNAMASGNTAQAAQIQQQININQQQNIVDVGNQLIGLLNASAAAKSNREANQREENRKTDELIKSNKAFERQQEQERAQAASEDLQRQWAADQQALGSYIDKTKNSDIPDKYKQVFFITYERVHPYTYRGLVKLKTYALNIYSDNTWMMQNDLVNKLAFKECFNRDTTSRLLGFFTSQKEALNLINKLKIFFEAKVNVDDSFIVVNESVNAKKKEDDFWKQ